jgi:hypothetical protein
VTDGPGPGRTEAPVTVRLDRSLGLRLVGLALALVALGALVVGSVHGARSSVGRADAASVASARLDDAYYGCLAAQAGSLVGPGLVVDVSTSDPGSWGTLVKVVAPRDVLTTDQGRSAAVLTLARRPGPGACLGSVVVARYPDGTVRQGTGGSLPGDESPPPPVL